MILCMLNKLFFSSVPVILLRVCYFFNSAAIAFLKRCKRTPLMKGVLHLILHALPYALPIHRYRADHDTDRTALYTLKRK